MCVDTSHDLSSDSLASKADYWHIMAEEEDFSMGMCTKIQEIDKSRAKQASLSAEEHALSDTWHIPLIYALMLEIFRKILLLGSEGLRNSFHFDPTDGTCSF
jgi:hypothetical protein